MQLVDVTRESEEKSTHYVRGVNSAYQHVDFVAMSPLVADVVVITLGEGLIEKINVNFEEYEVYLTFDNNKAINRSIECITLLPIFERRKKYTEFENKEPSCCAIIAYFINSSTDLLIGNFTTNDVKVLYTVSSTPIVLHANADYLSCGLHDGRILVWQLLNIVEFTDNVCPNWCVDVNVMQPGITVKAQELESFPTHANILIDESFNSSNVNDDNEIRKLCIEESFLFSICNSGRCIVLDIKSGFVRCQFNTQLTDIISCFVMKFPRLHYELLGVCTSSEITFFMPEWIKDGKSKNYTDRYKDTSKINKQNDIANVKNVTSENLELRTFTQEMRYVLHDVLSVQETLSCISCRDKYIVAGTTSGVVIVLEYNILNKLAKEICRIDLGYGVCSVQLYSSHDLIVINNARSLWKWTMEELECYTNTTEVEEECKVHESNGTRICSAKANKEYGDSTCNVGYSNKNYSNHYNINKYINDSSNNNSSSNKQSENNGTEDVKSEFENNLQSMENCCELTDTDIKIKNKQTNDFVLLRHSISDNYEDQKKEKSSRSILHKAGEELIIYIDDIDDDVDGNDTNYNYGNGKDDNDNRKKVHKEENECPKEEMKISESNQKEERFYHSEEEEEERCLLNLQKEETSQLQNELENAENNCTRNEHLLDTNRLHTWEAKQSKTAENAILSEKMIVSSKEQKVEQSEVLVDTKKEGMYKASKESYEQTQVTRELISSLNSNSPYFDNNEIEVRIDGEGVDTTESASEALPRLSACIVKSLDKLSNKDNAKLCAGPRLSSYKVNHLLQTTENGTSSHLHKLEEENEHLNSTTLLKEQYMQILRDTYDTQCNEEVKQINEVSYDNQLTSKFKSEYSLHEEPFSCILEEIRASKQVSATGLTREIESCSDTENRIDDRNCDDNLNLKLVSTAECDPLNDDTNYIASIQDDLMLTTFGKVKYKQNTCSHKKLADKLLNIHNHNCDDILYNNQTFSNHILCNAKTNNDNVISGKEANLSESIQVRKFTELTPFYLYEWNYRDFYHNTTT